MFTIELLPAHHGDSLWIEYGDPPQPRRILIDGGPRSSETEQRLRQLIRDRIDPNSPQPGFELVVVTHIDADHITGILTLLEDREVPLTVRDFWFNGWDQLPSDLLGAKQGEALSDAIRSRDLPWNKMFGNGAAVQIPENGPLPVIELEDDMKLTLLSPTRSELAALRPVWKDEVEAAGLVPGRGATPPTEQPDLLGEHPVDVEELSEEPFEGDNSVANGASIAFLAEHDGRRLLATGDAHAPTLLDSLQRLADQQGVNRVAVDAVKLPHHGSKYNLSRELVDVLDANRFLFSTNGRIFHHPDGATVARLVVDRADTELFFNYRVDTTERWESPRLQRRYHYQTIYPEDTEQGFVVPV
jgi:hypothetical protein